MNRNTELRHLPSVIRNNLSHILSSSWTELMENIPKTLGRNGQVENSDPKYLPEEIRYGDEEKIEYWALF